MSGRPLPKTNASRAQIGVLGDDARVYGGIHFYTSAAGSLTPLPFNLRTNIRNFLLEYLGTPGHPVPFGGRQDDLERLEQWRRKSEKRFLLLASPAGRGKSALLARWAEQLSAEEASDTIAVVFVPITTRFGTNLPELVFCCIAVQLAGLLDEEVPANYVNILPGFWQSLVGEYLRRALPDGRQLLLIVDGLDEAAWDVGPTLVPHDLPESTRVVVSVRYLAGDEPGPRPWLKRLGWERFRLAEAISLETLARAGVRDALGSMGRPLDALLAREDVIDQLYRLTGGDPLLVTLYVEWLHDQGEPAVQIRPEDLVQIEPDYKGFFDYWWRAQEQLWRQTGQGEPLERRTVRALVGVLATAWGPLSAGDLNALLPDELAPDSYTIRQALNPLRRFVLGDGEKVGYSFAHPRLADYFREEFLDAGERRAWRAAFVRWGLATVSGTPAERGGVPWVSPYLLQYFSRHLCDADEPVESFLTLLSDGWLVSWHRYSGSYTGFLRDVDTVLELLVAVDRQAVQRGEPAPWIAREIQCVLCHASVNALSERMPTDLLIALRRYAGWTDEQVLAYARQKQDANERAETLLELAPHLSTTKLQQTYEWALHAALSVQSESERANVLGALAPRFPQAVYQAALSLQDGWRARVLSELAPHLPVVVYEAALSLQDESGRAEVLSALAPYLPKVVYQAALSLEVEWQRANVLSELAPHLPQAVYQAALPLQEQWRTRVLRALAPHLPNSVYQAALSYQDEWQRANVLSELAPHLSEAEQAEAFRQALQATLSFQNEWQRASLLSELASHLPEEVYQAALSLQDQWQLASVLSVLAPFLSGAEQAGAYRQTLQAALPVLNMWQRVRVLSEVAPHLPEVVYQEVLSLKDEERKADVLNALAPYLPKTVYQTTLFLKTEEERVRVLSKLAPYLPQVERPEAVRQALDTALSLQDEWSRARLLSAFASYLLEGERAEAFRQALQAAPLLQHEWQQSRVLSELAPHLPEVVYQAAQSLNDEGWRANVLETLASHLPEVVCQAALSLQDESSRARVLRALAPHLPEVVYQAAQSLKDEGWRANVLEALAPHLPKTVYEAALSLQDEGPRARVLSELAPHLPEVVYQAALTVQDEWSQARLLSELAPHRPEAERAEAFRQALHAALSLQNESQRAGVLSELAPHLPEVVYEAALSLQYESGRAEVLSALAPYLPEVVYHAAMSLQDESGRAQVLSALAHYLPEVVYHAAMSLQDERQRVRVLSELAELLATLSKGDLYGRWESILLTMKRLPRSDALPFVAGLVPVIKVLGEDVALSKTLQAVQEVCQWWP